MSAPLRSAGLPEGAVQGAEVDGWKGCLAPRRAREGAGLPSLQMSILLEGNMDRRQGGWPQLSQQQGCGFWGGDRVCSPHKSRDMALELLRWSG